MIYLVCKIKTKRIQYFKFNSLELFPEKAIKILVDILGCLTKIKNINNLKKIIGYKNRSKQGG
jgi:hypothetical protein